MKKCTKCGVIKSLDAFHRSKDRKDGRIGHCKTCIEWRTLMVADRTREYGKERRTAIKFRARELWKAAKRRAAINGLEFNLTVSHIEVCLMIGTCQGSGVPFDLEQHETNWYNPFAPSIDKINPFKGYLDTNVRVVCNAYNLGKNQMTHEDYVRFCQSVVAFNVL